MRNVSAWIVVSAIVIGVFFQDITGYSFTELMGGSSQERMTPETLERMAEEQKQRLPISSNDGQTWVRTDAVGMTLRHTYRVARSLSSAEISSARAQAYRNIPEANCADRAVTRLLDESVRIEYAYVDGSNRELFTVSIDSASC